MEEGSPRVPLRKLEPGPVDGVYRLIHAEAKSSKKGYPYLSLRLGDHSGSIAARRWRVGEGALEALKEHEYLRVKGVVEVWDGRPQILIEELHPLEPDQLETLDPSDFQEPQRVDVETLLGWLRGQIEGIEDPWLQAICLSYLEDPFYLERLTNMPASVWRHHAYPHGYLEHICSLLKKGLAVWACEDWMDLDLIVAGIFLHDSGKAWELDQGAEPGYSAAGRLLGHIPLGLMELHRRIGGIDGFPEERRLQLEHIILSHHESARYGSTRRPAFAEAEVIRSLEGLDGRLEIFRSLLGADGAEGMVESERLGRWVYLGGKRPEESEEERVDEL